MVSVNRNGLPEKTNQSEQYVLNYSFDEIFKLLMVGTLGYNSATNTMDRIQVGSNGGLKTATATDTARYDLQSPVYYVGNAPIGSADTDTTWSITKYDLTTNPYSGKVAQNVAWSARTTSTYV